MKRHLFQLLKKAYFVVSVPISILFILYSEKIHPAYRMTLVRKFKLGIMMFLNTIRVPTASSFKAHLAMALKILEAPPEQIGDVVECGTWKGGSAANLSLICQITGRRLKIFDSFEGLPEGRHGDREAPNYQKGDWMGTLDEVSRNIQRYGAIEYCEFIRGWFEDTLPTLKSPVLLAWLDVDLEASLDACVKYIWPNLVEGGFIFIDECVNVNYSALFWSERWWETHFNRVPPGLMGTGTGLPLGDYYIGPLEEREIHPLQHPGTGAWTMKSMTGYWSYYPQDE
jgi:O-methyltransferase